MDMDEIKNMLTMPVPQAGRIFFNMGKNSSYKAARTGEMPVIRIGNLLRVPVPKLLQMIEDGSMSALVDKKNDVARGQ